jgi:hypothetical protein
VNVNLHNLIETMDSRQLVGEQGRGVGNDGLDTEKTAFLSTRGIAQQRG